MARPFTFGQNLWPHHLPIWSLLIFLSHKERQKKHNYFGRQIYFAAFWHCCCSWLESLGTKLSKPLSQRKQRHGNPPAPHTDRKGARKFFIGKNLEENTGGWAGTFLLTDWGEMQHLLGSLSTVILGRFGSLAAAPAPGARPEPPALQSMGWIAL